MVIPVLTLLLGTVAGAVWMYVLLGIATAREYGETVTMENQIRQQLRIAFETHGEYPESLENMRFTWTMDDPGPDGTERLLQNFFYKSLTTNYVLWRARFPAEKNQLFQKTNR